MKLLKRTVEEKDALEIRHQHCTNAKKVTESKQSYYARKDGQF